MIVIILMLTMNLWTTSALAGTLTIENHSRWKIKVSSIGGSGHVEAGQTRPITFNNTENGATVNIWWVKNVRQLCQIYTPWDRLISVGGKHTIKCLSKK